MKVEIKKGQIWADAHERAQDRFIRVDALADGTVHATNLGTGKSTAIRQSNFRRGIKGYFLAKDSEILLEVEKQLEAARLRETNTLAPAPAAPVVE